MIECVVLSTHIMTLMIFSALVVYAGVEDDTVDLEDFGLFFMLYFLILICYTYIMVFKIGAQSRSLQFYNLYSQHSSRHVAGV